MINSPSSAGGGLAWSEVVSAGPFPTTHRHVVPSRGVHQLVAESEGLVTLVHQPLEGRHADEADWWWFLSFKQDSVYFLRKGQ